MTRTRLSLDGQWEFFPDPRQQLRPETLGSGEPPRRIVVPGPWQAQFEDLRDYSGVAWYRCAFELPEQLGREHSLGQSATAILHFGAVDYYATVWLNGQELGSHEGGYLPFELCADGPLRLDGPNELLVRVVDPSSDVSLFPDFPFAEIPHGKQSWYGPIGGIWQSVYLELRHPVYLAKLLITPDVGGEQAHTIISLNRPCDEPQRLLLSVTDPHGHITAFESTLAAGESRYQTSVPIPEPQLWDTNSPFLYQMRVALMGSDGEAPLDVLSSSFGMRTIATTDDGHLVLNGRVLYVRGALDQDYYPKLIYTPFSDAELEDQFAKAKHMGLNCLRTHIKITDPRYYDAADRAGILIWTELPNWENLTEGAKRRARETIAGMIERDWNHPSIIIWTIINEGWGVDLAVNAEHRAWLSEMFNYVKGLDPHRLVVGNSPCFSNFHVVTDIEDFHNYYAIPDHYRQWRDWVESFASRPDWTFAHAYEDVNSWRQWLRDPWGKEPRQLAPEVRRRGNEPMMVSEFGNWGLPDVVKLRECYGGEPWWFETGIEWGDGVAYPHGIEQRFKAYHLDKVFPTISDLAAASQRMQYTALKYEIEQIRRYPQIVGYIITEFTDVHWESNGLLDMCRNPKAYYDVIGDINRADAIVPDCGGIARWEGDEYEIHLALSHFSPADLRGSRLQWHVDLWPEVSGVFENVMAEKARLTSIGTIRFQIPRLAQSARARLEMQLIDSNGEMVTRNHLELYVFPRSLAAPPETPIYAPRLGEQLSSLGYRVTGSLSEAELAVVDVFTDDLRQYLHQGGRVLWLADGRECQQAPLGTIGIAQRGGRSWAGDWASNFNWLRQDRMFGDIPSGGVVDFAFADLIPDQVIVGLNPRDFVADVHSGLFVGWIHHTVGLVAEKRFGSGRIMISTYHLRDHLHYQPVARIMLNDMIQHLASTAVGQESEPARVLQL